MRELATCVKLLLLTSVAHHVLCVSLYFPRNQKKCVGEHKYWMTCVLLCSGCQVLTELGDMYGVSAEVMEGGEDVLRPGRS